MHSGVSTAVKSLDLSFNGRWKNPLVALKIEKNFASFSLNDTPSKVLELQIGQTINLFKSVGSKQILRSPFHFLTLIKELNHSVVWLWSSL